MSTTASLVALGGILLSGCNNQQPKPQPSAPLISGNQTPTKLANDPRMSPQARAAIGATAGKTGAQ